MSLMSNLSFQPQLHTKMCLSLWSKWDNPHKNESGHTELGEISSAVLQLHLNAWTIYGVETNHTSPELPEWEVSDSGCVI